MVENWSGRRLTIFGRLKWEMRKENRDLGLPNDEDGDGGEEDVSDDASEDPAVNDADRRNIDLVDDIDQLQFEIDRQSVDNQPRPKSKKKKKGRGARPATPVEAELSTPLMSRKKGKRTGLSPDIEVAHVEAEQGSTRATSPEGDDSRAESGAATQTDPVNTPELTKREKRRAREAAKKGLQVSAAQNTGDEVCA